MNVVLTRVTLIREIQRRVKIQRVRLHAHVTKVLSLVSTSRIVST